MQRTMTRRQMGLVVGGLGAVAAQGQTGKGGTSIHQEIDFRVMPARIYDVLLDGKQFSAFTKETAEISPREGEAFRLFGGLIEGRNIELVPNRRIVQAWRPGSWPAGVYSIVRFELVAQGPGTRVVLDHSGFTEEKWETLREGWTAHYWEPLHKYLNG